MLFEFLAGVLWKLSDDLQFSVCTPIWFKLYKDTVLLIPATVEK